MSSSKKNTSLRLSNFFEGCADLPQASGKIVIHEAAHTILGWYSPSILCVSNVVIRDGDIHKTGSGYVMGQGTNFPTNTSRWYFLAMTLAGMAGELQFFGRFHGSTSKLDLIEAYRLAQAMVSEGFNHTSHPWEEKNRHRA
jgi:hypothetical protein